MDNWPVVGHEWAVRQLQLAVERDEVPHALLITGVESVGKYTLAHTLAQALLCQAALEVRPCGVCSACRRVESGNHPDLLVVEPEEARGSVKIDQIREVERFLALRPSEGAHKIALIAGFDQATTGAANALLKTLEEPPSYAHLVLLATDADVLLPTIVSRSQQLPLRPLDRETIRQALVERWGVAAGRAERLARHSGGRLGWAVQALAAPDDAAGATAALQTLLQLLQGDLLARFELAEALAKDTPALAITLEYWRTAWRDILLLQTQNAEAGTYREFGESLGRVAQRLSLEETTRTLRALERAVEALQRNVNTRLLVEYLALNLPRV